MLRRPLKKSKLKAITRECSNGKEPHVGNQPRPQQLFLFIDPWKRTLGQPGMKNYRQAGCFHQ